MKTALKQRKLSTRRAVLTAAEQSTGSAFIKCGYPEGVVGEKKDEDSDFSPKLCVTMCAV